MAEKDIVSKHITKRLIEDISSFMKKYKFYSKSKELFHVAGVKLYSSQLN